MPKLLAPPLLVSPVVVGVCPLQVSVPPAVAVVYPLQVSAPPAVAVVCPLQVSAPPAVAVVCPLQVSVPHAVAAVYQLPVLPWPLLAPPLAEVPDVEAVVSRLSAVFRAVAAEFHPWVGAECRLLVAGVYLRHFCRSVRRWP